MQASNPYPVKFPGCGASAAAAVALPLINASGATESVTTTAASSRLRYLTMPAVTFRNMGSHFIDMEGP
ncbi:hypothetical protein Aph02nite_13090 [Actinoplanes philippinensis]|nr:hypothetical protein Aph02nite_13090 [Actinoplanes philippinensis]